jgi:polygalacturonase
LFYICFCSLMMCCTDVWRSHKTDDTMKRITHPVPVALTAVTLALLAAGCGRGVQETGPDPWAKAAEIVDGIRLPVIPGQVFRLSVYGGTGDGLTDNRAAFEHVIRACSEAGGGQILVEPGDYLVRGPINLESHMDLHLEEGARLVFGNDPADYLPVVLTSWEGTRCYNYSPFIRIFRADDVSITGRGEIDGEGSDPWNGWNDLEVPDQELTRQMNNTGVPLEERIFGEGHFLRPHLVQFYQCRNVLVEDVKITDSPFWCLHFIYSENITVRGVRYDAYNLNNDGIDPESSRNVLIENVTFSNRDDNIAIKAGRDLEARTLGIPSENIVVRNCKFRGHNALAVGSEMSGGVHDVFVEHCTTAGNVVYGFYLKGNRDRGGEVSRIYGRNLSFDTTASVIMIDSDYKHEGSCCPPKFSNVRVEHVRAVYARDHGIYLQGYAERPLDSVTIRDVEILSARIPLEVTNAEHLDLEHVTINGETVTYGGEE